MNELTKTECENAIEEIETLLRELEERSKGIIVNCIYIDSLEILRQLVEEHFQNTKGND